MHRPELKEGTDHMRAAIVGVGNISRVLLPAIMNSPCSVEGIMSRSGERARRAAHRYGIGRVYDSLDQIDTEAVFVLTNTETHAEIAVPLLERGIHVFVEKPMAATLRDAERMVAAAERSAVLLMVGFNRRYAPVYEALKAAWAQQAPDVIVAQKCRPGVDYRGTYDNAIHMVDMMRWICGDAVDVTASSQFDDPFYETSCVAHIRFARAIGVLIANRSCGEWTEHVEAYGGGKSTRVDAPECFAASGDGETRITSLIPRTGGLMTAHERFGFQQEVNDFVRAVESGGDVRSPARDALETHRLMNQILRAAGLPDIEGDASR